MSLSINSNQAAYAAQRSLEEAADNVTSSVSKLTSGNRITTAYEDVAGLSIGTILQINVNSYQIALTNANQALTVLDIADNALDNVTKMLQEQKGLALQSNSGSLSDTERAFLDLEFQAITAELDRLVKGTTFNNANLIDGSTFAGSVVNTNTSINSSSGTVQISSTASTDIIATNVININGVTFTAIANGATPVNNVQAGTYQFAIGATPTVAQNIASLYSAITACTDSRVTSASYSLIGTSTISATTNITGGNASQFFVDATGTAAVGINANVAGSTASKIGVALGASNAGLGNSNYQVSGTVLDAVLSTATQVQASATRTMASGDLANNSTIDVNGTMFTFKTTLTGAANEILIGGSNNATVLNMAAALNASTAANVSSATYSATGASLALTITARAAGASMNSFSFTDGTGQIQLANGAGNGLDVSHVTNNPSFNGKLQGMNVTYISPNEVSASVQVGGYTYTSTSNFNTAPTAATNVIFTANDPRGGSFTLELAAANGSQVNSQTDANLYASRLNAGLSGLTISQDRLITSFQGVGNVTPGSSVTAVLDGSSFELSTSNQNNLVVQSVNIIPPPSGSTQSVMQIVISGETYQTSASFGDSINVGQRTVLTSTSNPQNTLTYIASKTPINAANPTIAVSLVDPTSSFAFENALNQAFGLKQGNTALNFQVGLHSTDNISVSIQGVSSKDLYLDPNGVPQTLSIGTAANADFASNILDNAIDKVVAIRAGVGASELRFKFATDSINSSIANSDAARSLFLDTDIAVESSRYAAEQVKLNASISLLAQANQQPQNLLKLIG